VHWAVQELVPGSPYLPLGAAAFVAFLPMHLAMTAAVNNDTLAELLLATILLLTIRYLKRSNQPPDRKQDLRFLVLMGVTTGLGFVTKSSVYVALPLVLVAIIIRHLWLDRAQTSFAAMLKAAALYLLPALVLGLPWWLRNMAIYGGFDILGLVRHDQVVVGQLRTAEFLAEHGPGKLAYDFLTTSFRSFWGQFGWMGVLLDQRIYQALAILSALALVGFALWAVRTWRRRGDPPRWQWAASGLLALAGLLTLASYLWYNSQFIQHQSRYLFPALVPISLTVALGWREVVRRDHALPLAALTIVAAVGLRAVGQLPNWPLLMLALTAAAFVLRRFLPAVLDPFIQASPYLLLILLDLVSLFLFVIPQLAV
jgi:4-amino-4-deoxy-L-arabinose transferase-like glycosyltransferase